MGVIAEGSLRGCQGLFTPMSLGYPLSFFNKNSTIKQTNKPTNKQTRYSLIGESVEKWNFGTKKRSLLQGAPRRRELSASRISKILVLSKYVQEGHDMTQEKRKICYYQCLQSLNTWSGRSRTNKFLIQVWYLAGFAVGGKLNGPKQKKKSFVFGPARHPNSPAAARQPIAVAQAHGRHDFHKQERKLYILLWSVPVLRVKSMFCDQPYQCVYAIQKYKKYDQKNNL